MAISRPGHNGTLWIYLCLSTAFFLTAGAGIERWKMFEVTWIVTACFFCLTILVFAVLATIIRTRPKRISLWFLVCGTYALGIVGEGLTHWWALRGIGSQTPVNVTALTAGQWLPQNAKFTALYLLFPILCMLQYILLRRLLLRQVVRILASVLSLCVVVALLSILLPGKPGMALLWRLDRFRGTFVSPNSFALTSFFLIQWLVLGMGMDSRRLVRIWYGLLLLILIAGIFMSGSRTTLVIFLLFLVLVPLFFRDHLYDLKRRSSRCLLVVAPTAAILVLTGIVVLSSKGDRRNRTILIHRSQEIARRIQTEGPMGVLFKNERRGLHAVLAMTFTIRSPLAGWGPGGFYREYPNVAYLHTGEVIPANDSALNHFLMIAGDLGIPLLFLNLLIVILPALVGWRSSRHLPTLWERGSMRMFAVGNAVFLLGANFIPPSYFPDLLWIWTAHLALLLLIAERSGHLIFDRSPRRAAVGALAAICTVGLILIGSGAVSLGASGYEKRQMADWWPWKFDHGCYPEETWTEGEGRWCGGEASLQIPVTCSLPDTVFVSIASNHPDILAHPVEVEYGGVSGPSEQVILDGFGWRTLSIPISGEYLYEPTDSQERFRWKLPIFPGTERFLTPKSRQQKRYLVLSFSVSPTWVPLDWGTAEDERELGVAVLIPEL